MLAVEREPVRLAALLDALGPSAGRAVVLEAVEALRRRSLVERAVTVGPAVFTLQSVVLEYVTDRLVENVADEILLEYCWGCGERFHFNPTNGPGKDCGLTWIDDDEEGLFQSRCIELACRHTRRVVFGTQGNRGIFFTRATSSAGGGGYNIPAYPVSGPIDIVGAGDSCSAGITCAMVSGATHEQAAAFGNLVASITIQQIGVTGTASPEQVRQRWHEVSGGKSDSPT